MFHRLLVGIDDTEQTEVTLTFAVSVAQQCGSTVRVYRVNAQQVGGGGVPLLTNEEATDVVGAIEGLRVQGLTASGIVHRVH